MPAETMMPEGEMSPGTKAGQILVEMSRNSCEKGMETLVANQPDSQSGINDLKVSFKGQGKKKPCSKKRRHTDHQIKQMEAFFKECPHPDYKEMLEMSRELGLEPSQVKYWFQNKRTQMRNQLDQRNNSQLRAENENLREENLIYKDLLTKTSCRNCNPTIATMMSFNEHNLRIENVKLKEEFQRISAIVEKYAGAPYALPSQFAPNSHF